MQSFTKNEIAWIITALEARAQDLSTLSKLESANNLERTLANLRAGQMTIAIEKLRRAVEAGNKRIEIKY